MVKRMNLNSRAKKKSGLSASAADTFHRVRCGPEPVITSDVLDRFDTRLAKLYTWHNMVYRSRGEMRELKRETIDEYVAACGMYDRHTVDQFKSAAETWVTTTTMVNAKLLLLKLKIPKELHEKLHDNVKHALDKRKRGEEGEADSEEDPDAEPQPKLPDPNSIQARTRESASDVVGAVLEMIDSGAEFSLYEWLQKNGSKEYQAKAIAEKFKPELAELREALERPDDQLKEAYKPVGRKRLNILVAQYAGIVADAERFVLNAKKARPVRQRREKPAHKLVNRMKFLREYPTLKLVSVDPTTIVGAQTAWLYNVKYKRLTVYRAAGPKGLTVSGSSLKNYDEKASIGKALRKPEETLSKVLGGAKPAVLDAIKTRAYEANGRVNADTVLLRAS